MFLYAQVDSEGVVVSRSMLAGEVEHESLVPLTQDEYDRIGVGWKRVGEEWAASP